MVDTSDHRRRLAARFTGCSLVAVMDTQSATAQPAGAMARLRALLGGSSEASVTRRLAGTIFIIRVFSAALAYFSQILLARWMGGSDYGVYVYVWTWVLLLGSMMDFGISGAKDHSGIPHQRRARAAARLPVRQPLDHVHRIERGFAAAGRRRQRAVALDRAWRDRTALHR